MKKLFTLLMFVLMSLLTVARADVYLAGEVNEWNSSSANYLFSHVENASNGYDYTLVCKNFHGAFQIVDNTTWYGRNGEGSDSDVRVGTEYALSTGHENNLWINGFNSDTYADVKFEYNSTDHKLRVTRFSDVYVAGTFTNWGDGKIKLNTTDGTFYSVTLTDKKIKTSDQFKLVVNGNWCGYDDNSSTVIVGNTVTFLNGRGDNAKLDKDVTNATFSFNLVDFTLNVTEPIPVVNKVETPTFTPAGGTYDAAQNVTIACTTEGATIYYTTDGSDPTNSTTKTQYNNAAIEVGEGTTIIKAYAVKEGMTNSDVAEATYTISYPEPYIIGDGINGIDPWVFKSAIDLDKQDGVYKGQISVIGVSDGDKNGYFAIGTVNASDWGTFNSYRLNPIDGDGDYVISELNKPIQLRKSGTARSFKIAAGEYEVTVDLKQMTVTVKNTSEEPVASEKLYVKKVQSGSSNSSAMLKEEEDVYVKDGWKELTVLGTNGVHSTSDKTQITAGESVCFMRVAADGTKTYLVPAAEFPQEKDGVTITIDPSKLNINYSSKAVEISENDFVDNPRYFTFNNGPVEQKDDKPGHGAEYNVNFYVYSSKDGVLHVGVSEKESNDVVTGVEDINVAGKAVKAYKVIENGQVVIVRGEQRFNIMGQPIR